MGWAQFMGGPGVVKLAPAYSLQGVVKANLLGRPGPLALHPHPTCQEVDI
jgi:hypothetical protein